MLLFANERERNRKYSYICINLHKTTDRINPNGYLLTEGTEWMRMEWIWPSGRVGCRSTSSKWDSPQKTPVTNGTGQTLSFGEFECGSQEDISCWRSRGGGRSLQCAERRQRAEAPRRRKAVRIIVAEAQRGSVSRWWSPGARGSRCQALLGSAPGSRAAGPSEPRSVSFRAF